MNEASKTRALWDDRVLSLMKGEGIDIGCGKDPILPHVERFDQEHGDANRITDFVKRRYDFVFSSHSLEHMHEPRKALAEWFSLVKPGGHLISVVPDEDLYEQGCFPSVFNSDHKHTFTISKARSWSPCSINVLDIVKALPEAELVSVELQSHGIEHWMIKFEPCFVGRWLGRVYNRVRRITAPESHVRWARLFRRLGAIVDQTALPGRVAQIQFVVRKKEVAS